MLQLMLGLRTLFGGAFDEVAAVATASMVSHELTVRTSNYACMMSHFKVTRTSTSSRRIAYAACSQTALLS